MSRYFIQFSFDGTNYHGWQLQKNAHTVQAELHKAMETVFRQKIETTGCGRTDTGVHAKEFFAHFDLPENFTFPVRSSPKEVDSGVSDTLFKLNSLLPKDIAVQNIFEVNEKVNARFDAVSRTYKYFIHHTKDPFLVNRSFYRRTKPCVEEMNETAKLLLNHRDFSCFSKSRTQVKTNICKISKAEWSATPDLSNGKGVSSHKAFEKTSPLLSGDFRGGLVFEIKADRFLRNMVRAIVGTLLEVGDGISKPADFRKILESKNRSMAGVSVPSCGLYLTEVKYPKEIFIRNS